MKTLESLILVGCIAFGLFVVFEAAKIIMEVTGAVQ
jgi:hypothetical protein